MSARGASLAAFLRGLAAIVAIAPFRALGVPGAVLGWLAGSVLRIRRAEIERAMRRAGVRLEAAPAMYRSLGRGVFELLWLTGASERRRARALDASVTFEPALVEALDASLARGPVVLAASHTGNWELVSAAAARLLAARGRALAIVAKPIAVGGFHAFCMRLRRAFGIEILAPDGVVARVSRVLGRGDVVAMPIDQVPDRVRHASRLGFLGESALVDRAPFALALRHRADVLVVGARRTADATVVTLLAAPAADPALCFRDAEEALARDATLALEAFVRREPAAWLWLHRRWRAPRERLIVAREALAKPV